MSDKRSQVIARFVQDPEWYVLEDLIHEFIDPLKELSEIDDKASAEDVKAQVKSNKLVYNKLDSFLRKMGMFKKERFNNNPDYK